MTPPNEKQNIVPLLELSDQTKDFLSHFPNSVFTYIPDHGQKPIFTKPVLDLTQQEKGYGIYFSINGFKDNKRVSDNLKTVNAFFCDVDFPKTMDRTEENIRQYKQDIQMELFSGDYPYPTFVVETRNGLHVYWCLEKKIDIDTLRDEDVEKLKRQYVEIEESILRRFEGDPGAKDLARVLRVPETLHQKEPTYPFRVKIISYKPENLYKYREIREAFLKETAPASLDGFVTAQEENPLDAEAKKKIESQYPRLERPSYKGLLDQTAAIPEGMRNKALLVIAYACKDSGWDVNKTLGHFGSFYNLHIREIRKTIYSAYAHNYDFGYKNEVMELLAKNDEKEKLSEVTSEILSKKRKVQNEAIRQDQKKMYLTYETMIAERYPHLKYKVHGDFYDYKDGVYKILFPSEIQAIFLNEMLIDGLMDFRKVSAVNDKIACFKALDGRTFHHDDENKDKNILNFKNGLLNLATLELMPHTPEYLSTIQIPVAYDKEAKAERWQTFVKEIMDEDSEQVMLLQQLAGYILTSDVSFAKAFILYGHGANGKSMFVRMISKLIGVQNVSNINLTMLTKHFGLTGLIGKRLNVIDEISGNYFESNVIKAIISGERLTTDIKFRPEPFDFDPIVKLIFSVNELPKINDTTPGLYRRFIIIPFTRTFLENPDLALESKLDGEMAGILNWAIEGLRALRKESRFHETNKNMDAMKSFKMENSPLAEFLQNGYEMAPITVAWKYSVPVSILYAQYKDYCYTNGYKSKALANFMRELMHANIEGFIGMKRVTKDRIIQIEGLRSLSTSAGEMVRYNDKNDNF